MHGLIGFRGLGLKVRSCVGFLTQEKGVVLAQWDECNAYRLRLQGGDEVHAPMDMDCFVTKA